MANSRRKPEAKTVLETVLNQGLTERLGCDKCLYLVTRSLDRPGPAAPGGRSDESPALNAFAITFGDRFPAAETY